MSGGAFNYDQRIIENLADQIENLAFNPDISHRVRTQMIDTINCLREASIRVNRLDYLLSGDDGEDTFFQKMGEELQNQWDNDAKLYRRLYEE